MYIKKEEKKLIQELSDYLDNISYPEGFTDWINSHRNDIGFKIGKYCTCGSCNYEFKNTLKVNNFIICPKCNKKLLIKMNRIKYWEDKQYLNLLEKFKDGYVVRQFELYQFKKRRESMQHHFTEISRLIISKDGALKGEYIINNMYKNTGGFYYIRYYEKTKYWKPSATKYYQYGLNSFYGKYFANNLDQLLKPKYFSVTDFINNIDMINICNLIHGIRTRNYILEMLVKSKLYNLALRFDQFRKGKFKDIFKLDMSYLSFMQDNNITYNQLEILQKIKIKDFDLIKKIEKYSYNLSSLLEYCRPYDLVKYNLKPNLASIYIDYLNFARELGFDMSDKKILYPNDLIKKHDDYMNQIEIKHNRKINVSINKIAKKLTKNIYKNKKYCIFPVKSIEELIDESNQQNNCVRTYAESIVKRKCDIYFMRLINNPDKSLVTVEVRNNKVVQQRIKNNADTTIEQKRFLKYWQKNILSCE